MPETITILPTTTAGTIASGFMDVVTDNIAPVLGVLAFSWGIYFITARLNKAKKGKI